MEEAEAAELQLLLGKQGEAVTVLRPIGTVRIEGKRFDAMAETGSIESGQNIEVIAVYYAFALKISKNI